MPERIPTTSIAGARGYIEVPTQEEAAVAALLAERHGYVMRGLQDRVAQVDAELARLVPPAEEPTQEVIPDGASTTQRRGPGRPRKGSGPGVGH